MNILTIKSNIFPLLFVSTLIFSYQVHAIDNFATSKPPDNKTKKIAKKATIDAKFSNIEIGKLLKLIAKIGSKSIVIAGGINQKISITFNNTAYDIALNSVLTVGKLEMIEDNGIIIVQTSENSRITESFIVKNVDVTNMEKTMRTLFGDQSKIQIDRNTNMILMTASRETIRAAKKIITKLDQPQKQVMIEAAFIEVSLDDNVSTGINLGAILNKFDSSFSVMSQGFASAPEKLANPVGLFASTDVYVGKTDRNINAMIEALQTVTDLKVLTHPKVIGMNDQEAELIVGKKLGFRVTTTTQTGTQESVEFLKVGTQLRFTPHITENEDIIITIHPEVSDGSISPDGLPSETTTEITTQVKIGNGQTFVLGGLIRERNEQIIQKVPLLGDIPFLGALFRRSVDSISRSEIMVFITPQIITDSKTTAVTRRDASHLKQLTSKGLSKINKTSDNNHSSSSEMDDQLWLWDDEL